MNTDHIYGQVLILLCFVCISGPIVVFISFLVTNTNDIPIPNNKGICGYTDINNPYSRTRKDIIIVCIDQDGWWVQTPDNQDRLRYRPLIETLKDSLRTEAEIRGIYRPEFDE